MMSCFCTNNS